MRTARRRALVAALVPLATGSLLLGPGALGRAGAVAVTATPSRTQAPLSAAAARALSVDVTSKVIIVLRNDASATPDIPSDIARRDAAIAAIQRPVLRELGEVHARDVKSVQLIDAVAATVSPGEAARLAANPSVARVVRDEPIPVADAPETAKALAADAPRGAATSASTDSIAAACSGKGKVQLDPEALGNIHAATLSGTGDSAQALGYTGKGVKVGFIADGLDVDNPDFVRADGRHVFVDYQDFSGTGTDSVTSGGEAFLDASSIAAQGRHVYNIQHYGDGLAKPCDIRILGVAPGASLVGLDVFGGLNVAFNSVFLEAINYAVNVDHVNVLNESFGDNPFPDTASLDLTRQADDAAVAAGVTVTASSGDAGSTDTIGSPATDPEVLSAGATTTYRSYAQTGIGGITAPGVTGWDDDNISGLSSGGVSANGSTVDVVAPGDLNWALCSPYPKEYQACTNFSGQPASVELSGGTSEASPLTAGTAALVIQAYAESHGGALPSPATVRRIIVSTAEDIDAPGDQQGAGLIDAYQAVKAAIAYDGDATAATGHSLIDGTTQFDATGREGGAAHLEETVTNSATTPVTVGLSSRTLGAYRSVAHGSVTLADATGDAAEVSFTVPAGQARLDGSIAYKAASGSSADFAAGDNLSLIAPDGHLAEYDLPQGAGNYGDAQVADPEAGTWHALIFGDPSTEGGTTGKVLFGMRVATWHALGTLSTPSLSLAPGATGTFSLEAHVPSTPGDEAGSIVLTDEAASPAFTAVTTVPVVLRALVPTPAPSTTFTGTLTGGNGRQVNTGVTDTYQVSIPAGTPALNAVITTSSPADTLIAELLDPETGESASTASSNLESHSATGRSVTVAEKGTQLHVVDPHPGVWTLSLNWYNQVSGTALSQPFAVKLTTTPGATADGLPDAKGIELKAGSPVTVPVTVTNRGTTPEAYFVDGRLSTSETVRLAPLTSSSVTVPIPGVRVPSYLVPAQTTSITASASAPAPILFDYSYAFGDPDLISSSQPYSDSASGTLTSADVAAGQWIITPFQDGPDGAGGLKPVTARTSMTATTATFDPAVSAPTGDLWQAGVDPTAAFSPYVVQPGQSVTIPVTITPQGPAGTTVSGTLYVGDATAIAGMYTETGVSNLVPEASDLAALPYRYTVG